MVTNMEVFETGKNNEQPAAKAEPIRSGDGLTPEEMYAKGMEKYNAGEYSDALVWFEKAAEQGDDKGQFYCGAMYHHGIGGTSEDMEKALMWYEKAAEQGNAEAQVWYGHIYYWGEGRSEDKEKALMWYKKAAEQGDALGQVRYGEMYYNGEGTSEDKAKALMWYKKAADGYVGVGISVEPSSGPGFGASICTATVKERRKIRKKR